MGAIAGVALGAGNLLPRSGGDDPAVREARADRYDLRRELRRREDEQEQGSEVGA